MKAILMAAGKGTRISRMIQDVPKSTLPINGVPLIRHTVEMLLRNGMEVFVCVGYQNETVRKALDGLNVMYYNNPLFDITNSIVSLWFARKEIDDDMLLMNADVYFSQEILMKILEDRHQAVVAMDSGRVEAGDYFFQTVKGCVKKYGKDLPRSERDCEYVGVAKIKKSFTKVFCQQMETMINNQQHGRWWEEVLYSMTSDKNIYTIDVKGYFWSEIDYFDDYERILMYIEKDQNYECAGK